MGYGSARRCTHPRLGSRVLEQVPSPHIRTNRSPPPPATTPPQAVKQIQWADAYYRSDIGWRAVERLRAGKH